MTNLALKRYCSQKAMTEKPVRLTEVQMCCALVQYLKGNGYEIYQEVDQIIGRVDVVAVKDGKQWAIEVKQSSCQDVLKQIMRWVNKCEYASIAVAHIPKMETRLLLDKYGIGILLIDKDKIKIVRSAKLSSLAKGIILFEEQKQNEAGHKHARCWFPSKYQKKYIKQHLSINYGLNLLDGKINQQFPEGIQSEGE